VGDGEASALRPLACATGYTRNVIRGYSPALFPLTTPMSLTYILVDFDNVKPSAADIGLVRGDKFRLAVVRGPQQTRYEADLAEALHDMGPQVTFTRCARAGKNAADMQIAYLLGELIATLPAGTQRSTRFVVISRDKDFDPLLAYLQGRGVEASRAASFKAALGGKGAETARPAKAARPAKTPRASAPAPARAAAKKAAEKTTEKAARKPTAARKASAAQAATEPRAAAKSGERAASRRSAPTASRGAAKSAQQSTAVHAAARTAARGPATPDPLARVVEGLQRKGDERPGKRKGLERFIESHLGRKLAPGQVEELIAQLEREGVIAFRDNKVEYRLGKAKKPA
jgi:hypothetical protein